MVEGPGFDVKEGYLPEHPGLHQIKDASSGFFSMRRVQAYPPFILFFLILSLLLSETKEVWDRLFAPHTIPVVVLIYAVVAGVAYFSEPAFFEFLTHNKYSYLITILPSKEKWNWVTLTIMVNKKPSVVVGRNNQRYLKFVHPPMRKPNGVYVEEIYVKLPDDTMTAEDVFFPRHKALIMYKGLNGITGNTMYAMGQIYGYYKEVPFIEPVFTLENYPEPTKSRELFLSAPD